MTLTWKYNKKNSELINSDAENKLMLCYVLICAIKANVCILSDLGNKYLVSNNGKWKMYIAQQQ